MDLSNLNILIIGASSGIGECLASILLGYGATVIGTYNKTKIQSNLNDKYHLDLKNELEIKKVLEKVIDKYKKIDVIVNMVGLAKDNDIYDKTKKEFMEVLEVNLVGAFLLAKYASLKMNKGVIINMSSTDAEDTFNPLSMDYSSSKAGVENLTKNLALRFPKLKICALAPNWVDTKSVLEMDPNYLKSELNRIGQKELIKKESVAVKLIEIIIDDDIRSGSIIRMGENL